MPTQWTRTLTPPPPLRSTRATCTPSPATCWKPPTTDHTAPTKPFTAALNGHRLVLGLLDDSRTPEHPAFPPAGTTLRLGSRTFQCSPDDHRTEPYARLAARPPTVKAHVEFRTPTYVKRSGR
ncbi:hypothetical protein [Nocardiopsis protaetiae]|uniref:hypothetical protein n=1 Tax=Nocardiopsis protaetiae TaxID=3382270 RepID=UPI00387A8A5B